MPEELSRNQSILRFDVILQHDWPIEQYLLDMRVFFGGKTKSLCFDLFIHWLIKQITNTDRNHFSRSYENRSIALIPSRLIRQMLAIFLDLISIGLYQSSGKEKEICCCVFPSSTKREIRHFHVVVGQRRQKIYKKA